MNDNRGRDLPRTEIAPSLTSSHQERRQEPLPQALRGLGSKEHTNGEDYYLVQINTRRLLKGRGEW